MEILFNDIRYAFRIMRKSPGFTLIIILTLALGIGANTSIFSIVNAVLLRSLPYYDPGRLVKITFNNPGIGLRDIPFSVPELEDLKSRAGVFEEVSVVCPGPTNLTGARQQPERLELLEVSPNYFSMLGTTPQIGRLFGSQDFALGFAEATVISDGLWRRSYGGDPNILGKHLGWTMIRTRLWEWFLPDFATPERRSPRMWKCGSRAGSAGILIRNPRET